MRPFMTSYDRPCHHSTKSSLDVLSLVSPASVISSTVLYPVVVTFRFHTSHRGTFLVMKLLDSSSLQFHLTLRLVL